MADLVVDSALLDGIASHAKLAHAEFTVERALAAITGNVFGSPAVTTAAERAASIHDAMIRLLQDDAIALVAFVTEVATATADVDTQLAHVVR